MLSLRREVDTREMEAFEKAPRFCSIIMVQMVQARILGRQEDTDRPISRADADSVCLVEQHPWTVSLVSRADHERALRCLGMQARIDMKAVISIHARLHNFSSGSFATHCIHRFNRLPLSRPFSKGLAAPNLRKIT